MSKYISQYGQVASSISGDYFVLQRGSVYKKIDFDDLTSSIATEIGAGVTLVSELLDVDLTYLSNGDVLQYNSVTEKWEAVTISSSTNLSVSNRTSTTLDVLSDTGTDATIPNATDTLAGLLSSANFNKLAYISITQAVDLDAMEVVTNGIASSLSTGYIPYLSATNVFSNSPIYRASSTTLGIFGVTAPTFSLGISGQTAISFGMERHTTADTAGNNLTIQAGGATSGATNKTGGVLVLSSGIGTGTGGAGIQFYTTTAGGSGTTDLTPTLKATITGTGHLNMEASGFIQFSGYTYLHATRTGFTNPSTNGVTFLGYSSGLSNTANYNTGIGWKALETVSSGEGNTALGNLAGAVITTSSYSTHIGYNAGNSATGTSNTTVGQGAGGGFTSGTYNSYFGRWAGLGNASSGSYNTMIGYNSGATVSTGSYNTGIGTECFNGTSITGNNNVALGYNAGVYVRTSSAGNTFLGATSGVVINTGPFNYSVAIGYQAMSTASNTCVLGGNSDTAKISDFFFGNSDLYDSTSGSVTQSTITIRPGGTYYNSGANMGGHNLAIGAGKSTGAGNAGTGFGNLLFQTTAVTGSGSTLNSLVTRMTILGNTGYVGMQGITAPTAFLHLAPSTTSASSLCVPHGSAPSSPVNGDMWTDTSGAYIRINGVTKTFTLI